jgi:hypothetical protein
LIFADTIPGYNHHRDECHRHFDFNTLAPASGGQNTPLEFFQLARERRTFRIAWPDALVRGPNMLFLPAMNTVSPSYAKVGGVERVFGDRTLKLARDVLHFIAREGRISIDVFKDSLS